MITWSWDIPGLAKSALTGTMHCPQKRVKQCAISYSQTINGGREPVMVDHYFTPCIDCLLDNMLMVLNTYLFNRIPCMLETSVSPDSLWLLRMVWLHNYHRKAFGWCMWVQEPPGSSVAAIYNWLILHWLWLPQMVFWTTYSCHLW